MTGANFVMPCHAFYPVHSSHVVLEELEHSGQVLSSAFSADGSFVGSTQDGPSRSKDENLWKSHGFVDISKAVTLCADHTALVWRVFTGELVWNLPHTTRCLEMWNGTLPLNARWQIWKICKWVHWGSQIRRPFRSCAVLSSLLTDFFESAKWYGVSNLNV